MRINRISVSAFFFVNGFLYANWVARLPELQVFFDLTDKELGYLLFVTAIGAIVSMPTAGWLTTQFGSKRITQVCGILFCAMIPFLPIYPNVGMAAVFFVAMGFFSGAMDVAMNGQAVVVERAWGKSIMSSFHAIFSIGMALGAGSGALFAKQEIPLSNHFLYVVLLGIAVIIWASFYLVEDDPIEKTEDSASSKLSKRAFFTILPLGIIAFCGMTGEGSMADWSTLFVHKVVGESEAFSALALGAFSTAMTVGRIFGDYFTEKLGKGKLLILDSILALVGLSIALGYVSAWTSLIGFFFVGLGLATIVPIIYSTAGNTPGLSPSVGIAVSTSIGYSGFFIGPPLIGFLSDEFGLRIGLCFTLILFAIMFFLVLKLARHSFPPSSAAQGTKLEG